jgi:[ribosomal protein S18]-alanine N-acetyltransferase
MKVSDGQSVRIRKCTPADLDGILEIEREAFPDPYDRFTFIQLLAMEPGGFLVAEGDGLMLGYIVAVIKDKDATVFSIAVRSGARRRGVGRRLLEAELSHLSKVATRMFLQVSVDNLAAIELYRTFGFVEQERLKRYYSNGDDAIVMSLALTPDSR